MIGSGKFLPSLRNSEKFKRTLLEKCVWRDHARYRRSACGETTHVAGEVRVRDYARCWRSACGETTHVAGEVRVARPRTLLEKCVWHEHDIILSIIFIEQYLLICN